MAIYRGDGGAGDATTDITISAVTEKATQAAASASAAADSATAAAASAVSAANNIPSQSGNSGKFLTTNGSATSWGTVTGQTNDEIKAAVEAASDSNTFTDADHTKLNGITASANNYVHPNHSGEVTSTADGATVIASNIVDEDNLKVSNSPTNGYFLSAQSGDSGGLTWAAQTTYSVGDGGLTSNDFTDADHTKLNGIEASADVTDATNVVAAGALMDSEITNLAQVKAFDSSDYATSAQGTKADAALPKTGGAMTGAITTNSTFDGRDVATDGTKLDGIESSATADQTASEIRALVESATDSNVFTDADHSKLNGIEASADVTDTANVTSAGALMDSEVDADIKTLSLPASTTISTYGASLVDDADAAAARTTLGLGTAATTASSAYATAAQGTTADAALPKAGGAMTGAITTNSTFDGRDVATDGTKLDGIAASANNYVHPNHSGEVTSTADGATVIASNVVDEDNLKVSNSPVNGYVLTAQSGDTGGLTWAAASGGGGGDLTKIATQAFNGSVTSLTFTDCFSDTYDSYKVIVTDVRDSSSDYYLLYGLFSSDSGSSFLDAYGYVGSTQTKLRLSGGYDMGTSSAPKILHQEFLITGARDTDAYTLCDGYMNRIDANGISDYGQNVRVSLKSKVAIDTFKIYPSSGTPDAGTITIYGFKG